MLQRQTLLTFKLHVLYSLFTCRMQPCLPNDFVLKFVSYYTRDKLLFYDIFFLLVELSYSYFCNFPSIKELYMEQCQEEKDHTDVRYVNAKLLSKIWKESRNCYHDSIRCWNSTDLGQTSQGRSPSLKPLTLNRVPNQNDTIMSLFSWAQT